MDLPKVTNVRQLTPEDADVIIAAIKRDEDQTPFKYTDFDIVIANDYDLQGFIEQDFVIGDVVIEGVAYKFIHGYPGDEPNGVLYTPDFKTICGVHWSQDKGDPLTDWYLKSVNQYSRKSYEASDSEGEMQIPKTWYA